MSPPASHPLRGPPPSPLKVSVARTGPDHSLPTEVTELRKTMGVVTRNKFVRTECARFYEKCAPCAALSGNSAKSPKFDKTFKGITSKPHLERDLYGPLCKVITRLCPGYVCRETSENYDADDPTKQKVDLALFREDEAPSDRSPNWARQALHIEVKRKAVADDPFDDTPDVVFQLNTDRRSDNRNQITSYADMLFRTQHRSFCFTVIIFGHCARIIRWDRSGAIVTEVIDYQENPAQLAEFFRRFARMTREEQGYDTTVIPVDEASEDAKKMKAACEKKLEVGDYVREMFKKSLEDNGTAAPKMKIRVYAEDIAVDHASHSNEVHREYLVGNPRYAVHNIIGRCTRGYVALDAKTEEFVWLKDAWRVNLPRMRKEGDILRDLQVAGVENVPTLICHGDIPGQETLADKEWADLYGGGATVILEDGDDDEDDDEEETALERAHKTSRCGSPPEVPGNGSQSSHSESNDQAPQEAEYPELKLPRNPLKAHTHYRLVTKEVGLPLDDFKHSKELLFIIWCCVIAHSQAYERLSLLHRDISAGNVLIFEKAVKGKVKRVGILADWELAKKVNKKRSIGDLARQPDRTGTWQFSSAMSLQNSRKPIVLQDDLESFHHLITYQGIRWVPNTCGNVAAFMADYFDGIIILDDMREYGCGPLKFNAMDKGILEYAGKRIKFHSGLRKGRDADDYPLTQFHHASSHMFYNYYQVIRHDFPELYVAPVAEDPKNDVPVQTGHRSASNSDSSEPDVRPVRPSRALAYARGSTAPGLSDNNTLAERRKVAGLLDSHQEFADLLLEFATRKDWRSFDKVPKDKRQPVSLAAREKAVSSSSEIFTRSDQGSHIASGTGSKQPSSSSKHRGRRAPPQPPTTSTSVSSKRSHTDSMTGGGGGSRDQPAKRHKIMMDGIRVPPAPYPTLMPPPPTPPRPSRTTASRSMDAPRTSSRLRSRARNRSARLGDDVQEGSSPRRSTRRNRSGGSSSGRRSPRSVSGQEK